MLCKPVVMKTLKELRQINVWDLLTGIPAGMSAFVAAAVISALYGELELSSEKFLWLLVLTSALISILVGLTRGAHAAPSALVEGLFVFGATMWLWIRVYANPQALLGVLYIFIIILIVPIIISIRTRDLRSAA